jgi:hypothetical protein
MEKTDVLPERNKNTNLEKRKKLKENGRLRRMKKRNKN